MARRLACVFLAAFVVPMVYAQRVESQLSTLFGQLGLTTDERAATDAGRPVVKALSWGKSSEIYIFGAVYINGSPTKYLALARDLKRLAGTPGYLGIGELTEKATASDVAALSLDNDDIKSLKSCKEGDCDVQLPTNAIRAFQESVKWTQPDAADQANALARQMILDLLRAYIRGGNGALGVYRDKEHPAQVADQFETMVGRSASLPDVVPELRAYLLQYPNASLTSGEEFFYWEHVDFGLKPTIRVNHAVVYHTGEGAAAIDAVAIKQLYASHYFHTALDMSVCLQDSAKPDRTGFYLLTLKSSEQDGLTGPKGSIVRRVVVSRTKSALEKALADIKNTIERATTGERKAVLDSLEAPVRQDDREDSSDDRLDRNLSAAVSLPDAGPRPIH
jgi:hypothetical protein